MPYKTNNELPNNVKANLPSHAQTIYLKAFNNALKEYEDPEKRYDDSSLEEVAHKVAWAAVKSKYYKDSKDDSWKPK